MTEVIETKSTVGRFLLKPTTKLLKLVKSRHAVAILGLISFTESLLPLPILTDPFLVTAALFNRSKVRKLVMMTTISSVVGGIVTFIVPTLFKERLLSSLSPEMLVTLNSFVVEEQGVFLLTIVGAITPVPYTVVAWAVALSGGNILVFIIASLVGRSFRYGVVGWCTYKFGPTALKHAQRSILLTSVIVIALFALYIWLKV